MIRRFHFREKCDASGKVELPVSYFGSENEGGNYVLYSDHLSAIAEKEKEIEGLRMYKESTQGYESAREKEITRLSTLLAEMKYTIWQDLGYAGWQPTDYETKEDFLEALLLPSYGRIRITTDVEIDVKEANDGLKGKK